jgi:DNA-binding SARP family transcriptional activator/tetratricopeptide (TPR) repeat protein/DNA-binding XRE family transcriptional regulator
MFGHLLRTWRREAGLTQHDLAAAAGVSLATVRDLEQQRSHRPRPATIKALTRTLALSETQATRLMAAAQRVPASDESEPGPLRLRVLGPFTLTRGDTVLNGGSGAQRTMLALLAIHPNQTLSREHLIDVLWPDNPPPSAVNLLQTYVARLRRTLRRDDNQVEIESVPGGYRLVVADEALDLVEFRRAVARAGNATDSSVPTRVELLATALDLCHGEPVADVAALTSHPAVTALREEHIAAGMAYAEAVATQEDLRGALPRLRAMAARHPLHEPLQARLVEITARSGDQAGALQLLDQLRGRLLDELGIAPGRQLEQLRSQILLGRLTPAIIPDPGAQPLGCQLPPDIPDYTGFESEITQVCRRLTAEPDQPWTSPSVVAICGQPGVGKTALAIHSAYRLRSAFPNGQLFVSLGGGLSADEAMNRVLRALGTPDPHATFDEKISNYRSSLRDRRVLLVLDDASSAGQVRPFLPTAGSAVLISTRSRLTTLPGIDQVELNPMTVSHALALLARVVGTARIDAERVASAKLVRLCARLPLALRIAAARLAAHPHWTVRRLVHRLADERGRLNELVADDLEVRAGLAVGYDSLTPASQHAFRMLGLVNPPDFAAWTVAALMDTDLETAEDLADDLADARMIEIVTSRGPVLRYRMHDLVRLYATERAAEEARPRQRAAVARLITAVLHVMGEACVSLPSGVPHLYPPPPPEATPPKALPQLYEHWLDAEEFGLVAAIEAAATLQLHELTCLLAERLTFASFGVRNKFPSWDRVYTAAARSVRQAGDKNELAVIEYGFGHLRYKEDRFAEASQHFRATVTLFREVGRPRGEAAALIGLGTIHRELGENRTALPLLYEAIRLIAETGDQETIANAHYGIGYAHRELGEDDLALHHLNTAETTYRAIDHRRGELIAIRATGLVYRARGELEPAERFCTTAHNLAQEVNDSLLLCYTTQALAKIWIRQGRPEHAHLPLIDALYDTIALHDRFGTALVQRTIGEMHLAAHRPEQALQELHTAHAMWTELDHALGRARVQRDIGAAYAVMGNCPTAHDTWREAITTFRALGTREAAELDAWRHEWGCHCAVPDLKAPA